MAQDESEQNGGRIYGVWARYTDKERTLQMAHYELVPRLRGVSVAQNGGCRFGMWRLMDVNDTKSLVIIII